MKEIGVKENMGKLIDLSQTISHQMSVHPYDDPVRLFQDKYLAKDKFVNHRIEAGMHAGTHIDTPMHLTNRETFIDEISLERFVGRGCLLDVRNQEIITFKEEYAKLVQKGDIVLLFTDHSHLYGTEEYYDKYPIVDKELAEFFIERKIKMLGIDFPSPDQYPFDIHKMLFDQDILIIENLTNLDALLSAESIEIIALPLKIRAEASLARVVARI